MSLWCRRHRWARASTWRPRCRPASHMTATRRTSGRAAPSCTPCSAARCHFPTPRRSWWASGIGYPGSPQRCPRSSRRASRSTRPTGSGWRSSAGAAGAPTAPPRPTCRWAMLHQPTHQALRRSMWRLQMLRRLKVPWLPPPRPARWKPRWTGVPLSWARPWAAMQAPMRLPGERRTRQRTQKSAMGPTILGQGRRTISGQGRRTSRT
mmetsp:Transcript_35108/g.113094  ORF Transcript_35108/g.113094 Transcript_35108/m.113094 type:complete len:208 (-) Transcript_35108:3158-3781(-)